MTDLRLISPCSEQWRQILTALQSTSHPWITWKDPINLRALNNNTGTIHMSNLCTEICLPQDKDNIAVCNLISVNLGAHVATTVSGADKARFVESLGAERTIDYKSQDFVEQTLAWTNGKGADVVLDTVGGPAFCQSFGAVRLYGRLATLLSTACELPQINKARLRNIVVGYEQMTMPLLLGNHDLRCAQTRILERGAKLFDEGKLKVEVSSVLPLGQAPAAHKQVEDGHTTGKVVLQVE